MFKSVTVSLSQALAFAAVPIEKELTPLRTQFRLRKCYKICRAKERDFQPVPDGYTSSLIPA